MEWYLKFYPFGKTPEDGQQYSDLWIKIVELPMDDCIVNVRYTIRILEGILFMHRKETV